MRSRIAKVSAANLPQEYHLVRLLAEVHNLDESWSLDTPACEWEGVGCNEREEVSRMEWGQLDLSGAMNLIYLPHSLYDFDARQNALEGAVPLTRLPSELRSLAIKIQFLYLVVFFLAHLFSPGNRHIFTMRMPVSGWR